MFFKKRELSFTIILSMFQIVKHNFCNKKLKEKKTKALWSSKPCLELSFLLPGCEHGCLIKVTINLQIVIEETKSSW